MAYYTTKRNELATDTECLPGYWSIAFVSVADRSRRKLFELYEGHPLDVEAIRNIFLRNRIFTFNGNHYDIPMICLALSGASNEELKAANDTLIVKGGRGLQPWEFMDRNGLDPIPRLDHIDLISVAPSAARDSGKDSLFTSLKMYAAMMASKTMQDMPIHHDEFVTPDKRQVLRDYCYNDCEVLIDLREELHEQIKLREQMSDEYGVDMRSKSDAQVGEQVMKCKYKEITGKTLYKPDVKPGPVKFVAPAHIAFKTPTLQAVFHEIVQAPFIVRPDGYIEAPECLKDRPVQVGDMVFTMGIGGIHSTESCVTHYETEEEAITDSDVTGYYPNNMIATGREPDTMQGIFQPIFRGQVKEREVAKAAKQYAIAESRKIVCNGLFGKTGSRWSVVYSPGIMVQTTVGGQLSLLMFVEAMTLAGFKVISANTDGVVVKYPRARLAEFMLIVMQWEDTCQLKMEHTEYRSMHSRDVNTYIAVTTPGKDGKVSVKRIGKAAPSGRGIKGSKGLKKNPDAEIAYDAVVAFVKDGVPLERTIYGCKDIRKFITSTKVDGGALFRGELVGKTIRFYHCNDSSDAIYYKTTGNTVPKSTGTWPCMVLPDEFPENVDIQWYVREANQILIDMGMQGVDPDLVGRAGTVLARLDDQKTFHTIELPSGVALCGRKRDSLQDRWIEHKRLPDGYRHCKKCRDLEI